jgi:hypothetical protein
MFQGSQIALCAAGSSLQFADPSLWEDGLQITGFFTLLIFITNMKYTRIQSHKHRIGLFAQSITLVNIDFFIFLHIDFFYFIDIEIDLSTCQRRHSSKPSFGFAEYEH